jgi:hypothetical protein
MNRRIKLFGNQKQKTSESLEPVYGQDFIHSETVVFNGQNNCIECVIDFVRDGFWRQYRKTMIDFGRGCDEAAARVWFETQKHPQDPFVRIN